MTFRAVALSKIFRVIWSRKPTERNRAAMKKNRMRYIKVKIVKKKNRTTVVIRVIIH